MNDNKCCFDKKPRACGCLTVKECEGCVFKKTEKEYNEGIRHAQEILKAKKLAACREYDPAKRKYIMTTTTVC